MILHEPGRRDFGSDNFAGMHPLVMAALQDANSGHVPGYGDDPYTEKLGDLVRDLFGPQALVFPVFNGTGGNVVALSAMTPRWGSVVATENAHIHTDEAGAPEHLAGIKVLTTPAADGKLSLSAVTDLVAAGHGVHSPAASVVSLAQASELGTVYHPDELAQWDRFTKDQGLGLYLDGARLANAAAYLQVGLSQASAYAHVLTLGGTKLGALGAEAVIVRDPARAPHLDRIRKMSAQLASKSRFISAQLLALYQDDLWLDLARHANAMAQRLATGLRTVPGVKILHPVESNGVFVAAPPTVVAALRERWTFYDWAPDGSQVRLMCAWDTDSADVDQMVAVARSV